MTKRGRAGNVTWFERWPRRLAEERRRLEELGFRLDAALLRSARTISFSGKIACAGSSFDIEVQFPAGFPDLAPQLYGRGFLLPRHHDPVTGNLCVLSSDDWQPSMSARDLVARAGDLIAESLAGTALSPEPRLGSYPYARETCVLVPPTLTSPPPGKRGTFRAALAPGPGIGGTRGVLLEASSDLPRQRTAAADPWQSMHGGHRLSLGGMWFRAGEPPPPTNDLQLFSDWAAGQGMPDVAAAAARQFCAPCEPARWPFGPVLAVVYRDEAGGAGQEREYWLFGVIQGEDAPRLELLRAYQMVEADRAGRVPFHDRMAPLTVTAVGLGAVGSLAAVELARCGVGGFNLIDPDILEPGNLVRHACGLDEIGRYKVAAVARRILEQNPFLDPARVRMYPFPVGHRQDQVDVFMDLLSYTDILISATADGAVDRLINAICLERGVPAVFAWVSGGAWGGRVFRVIPGETGCYECAGWAERRHWFRPPASDPRAIAHYDVGCASPTFTGVGFDVRISSQFAARLAVQTLLRSGGDGAAPYPDSPGHQVVFSLRRPGGKAGFSVRFLPLPRDRRCTTCGPAARR